MDKTAKRQDDCYDTHYYNHHKMPFSLYSIFEKFGWVNGGGISGPGGSGQNLFSGKGVAV